MGQKALFKVQISPGKFGALSIIFVIFALAKWGCGPSVLLGAGSVPGKAGQAGSVTRQSGMVA